MTEALLDVAAEFALMVLFALTPLPAEIAALAIALRNPFGPALALIWTGTMAGAALGYGLAWQSVGVRRWLCRWQAVAKAEARLRDLGWLGILVLRLIPVVPFFAVSLAAGLLRVPPGAFFAGTAVGIIPAAVALALIGRGLMSESAGAVIAAVGTAVALILIAAWMRWRRLW